MYVCTYTTSLQITAYILGALYFTAGGPSALEYSGESIVFRQDTTANRVQLQGDILSPGVGRLGVSGSSQGVCLQGGNYRNTPFGGEEFVKSVCMYIRMCIMLLENSTVF